MSFFSLKITKNYIVFFCKNGKNNSSTQTELNLSRQLKPNKH